MLFAIDNRLPRRDLTVILGSIVAVLLLCWWYLFTVKMPMQIPVWDASYFLLMLMMWAIMMVGMMLPSVTPTVLIYAAVARKAAADGAPIAATFVFVIGYLLVWVLFSLGATLLQWALDEASLLSPMMATNSTLFGAGLLIAAGVYQMLPVKEACLEKCRNPVQFISENWRNGEGGAMLMGVHHGLFCLGCCWVLMGLLFLGGVMNLVWIALITLFVLAEKLLPFPRYSSRVTGSLMIVAGMVLSGTL